MAEAKRLGVSQAKVTAYLLNPDHPEGWSKAKFFLARGFDRARPEELASALAWQARRRWPGDVQIVPGAVKHRVQGPIECPNGSTPDILTVWQVGDDEHTAFLVTARPGRLKSG